MTSCTDRFHQKFLVIPTERLLKKTHFLNSISARVDEEPTAEMVAVDTVGYAVGSSSIDL